MIEKFYYSTRNYDIISNYEIAKIYFILNGIKLSHEELTNPDFIDEIANHYTGILKRVENPSWRLLANNGHVSNATIIYKETHPDVNLSECRKRVGDYIKGGKKDGSSNNKGNAVSNNESVSVNGVATEGVSHEAGTGESDILNNADVQ